MPSDAESRVRALEQDNKKLWDVITQLVNRSRQARSDGLAGGGGLVPSGDTASAVLVRITSTTPDGDGHLPGQIRLYDTSTGLYDWKECRVLEP